MLKESQTLSLHGLEYQIAWESVEFRVPTCQTTHGDDGVLAYYLPDVFTSLSTPTKRATTALTLPCGCLATLGLYELGPQEERTLVTIS